MSTLCQKKKYKKQSNIKKIIIHKTQRVNLYRLENK